MHKRHTLSAAAAALALIGALSACSPNGAGTTTNTAKASDSPVIALLLPDTTSSARWETQDKPLFIAAVKKLDPDATVIATNAGSSAATQQQQAEAALAKGADALVITPTTGDGAVAIAQKAKAQHVPVIAYDTLLQNAPIDGYVSFDAETVGKLQAQYLATSLAPGSSVALLNGAQTNASGIAFKKGAHAVLDPLFASKKLKLVYEADTAEWLPSNAQKETEEALTNTGNKIDGILAANDGLAQGAIAALQPRGLAGKVLITGQDATLTGVQNIVLGDQSETVFKDINAEATAAAQAALSLARGKTAIPGETGTVDNGSGSVPSILLTPVSVTKSNIASTVIAGGLLTKAQICTGAVAAKCDF